MKRDQCPGVPVTRTVRKHPVLDHKSEPRFVTTVWTAGTAEIPSVWMLTRKPFGEEARRAELRDRLNAIPGVAMRPGTLARRSSISLTALVERASLDQFLATLTWCANEVRAI